MKKKLFIGTVLPTIAALGVIGSGFSLWIFSDSNSATATGSISVNVENVARVGSLEIKNGTRHTGTDLSKTDDIISASVMTLTFDQTATQADGLNPNGKGIYFAAGKSNDTESYESLESCVYTFTGESWEQDQGTGSNLTFTTTISVPAGIANYVKFSYSGNGTWTSSSTAGDAETINNTVTYTLTLNASDIISFDTAKANGVTIFDWNKVTPAYTKEPTTLAEYKTMKTAVETAQSISTVYNATVALA